jgi:transcription initiation factor TFIIIB Brf1 subunit/transcription initiation factor TFIIB
VASQYNASVHASVQLKVVGRGRDAYLQNLALVQTTGNYDVTRRRNINREMEKWIYKYKGDHGIPRDVIRDAADKYNELPKQKIVQRGRKRQALMGILLYYECISKGIPRKQRVIAEIVGITDTELSKGNNLLQEYMDRGLIEIPKVDSSVAAYIAQYFEVLGIDEHPNAAQYRQFTINIIEASQINNIRRPDNNARPTTRCAGAVYLLAQHTGLKITKEQIETHCQISKSTFSRFAKMVNDHMHLDCIKEVFLEYSIPLKI